MSAQTAYDDIIAELSRERTPTRNAVFRLLDANYMRAAPTGIVTLWDERVRGLPVTRGKFECGVLSLPTWSVMVGDTRWRDLAMHAICLARENALLHTCTYHSFSEPCNGEDCEPPRIEFRHDSWANIEYWVEMWDHLRCAAPTVKKSRR